MSDVLFIWLGLLIAIKNVVFCLICLMAGSGLAALWWAVLATVAVLFVTHLVWPNMSTEQKANATPRAGRVSYKEYV